MPQHALSRNPLFKPTQVLNQLRSGQVFYLKARKGNGMIICHPHYAEVIGPGSAIGGIIDLDCVGLIPLGRVALTYPETPERKHLASLTRRQWIEAIRKIVDCDAPLKRARLILVTMERYFGASAIAPIEDEVLSSVVGVLPQTITIVRRAYEKEKTRKLRRSQASRIAATARS